MTKCLGHLLHDEGVCSEQQAAAAASGSKQQQQARCNSALRKVSLCTQLAPSSPANPLAAVAFVLILPLLLL